MRSSASPLWIPLVSEYHFWPDAGAILLRSINPLLRTLKPVSGTIGKGLFRKEVHLESRSATQPANMHEG